MEGETIIDDCLVNNNNKKWGAKYGQPTIDCSLADDARCCRRNNRR